MTNVIETLAELIDRQAVEGLVALGQSTDFDNAAGHCLRRGLAKAYSDLLANALHPNFRHMYVTDRPSNVAPMRAKSG